MILAEQTKINSKDYTSSSRKIIPDVRYKTQAVHGNMQANLNKY